jgi:phosphopantetheinyl transferase
MGRRRIMSSRAPIKVAAHLLRLDCALEDWSYDIALTEADRRRAAEISSLPQRAAFLAARKALRELLAARLGCAPASAPIFSGRDGKPRLASGNIEFSLSHRDRWCAVALSADAPVGIDVEPVRPLAGMEEIVAEFFPPVARTAFASAAPDRRQIVFFRWWTRIEAAVKASGRGLDSSISCFDGVVYQTCEVVPGLAVSVAVAVQGPVIIDWQIRNCNPL